MTIYIWDSYLGSESPSVASWRVGSGDRVRGLRASGER